MLLSAVIRRPRILSLGLLWGLVAGGLQAYQHISTPIAFLSFGYDLSLEWWKLEMVLAPIIGAMAGAFLIAVLIGSTLFGHGITSKRWLADWVFTGAVSCAGGAAVSQLVFLVGILDEYFEWMPVTSWYEVPIVFVALVLVGGAHAAETGVRMGMVSAVVALALAPLSLVARRLILRRQSGAGPAGDS